MAEEPKYSPVLFQSEIWQHKKSGGLYAIVDDNALIEEPFTKAVAYRSLFDGQLWVRPHAEFFDGRFRNLSIDEVARTEPQHPRRNGRREWPTAITAGTPTETEN